MIEFICTTLLGLTFGLILAEAYKAVRNYIKQYRTEADGPDYLVPGVRFEDDLPDHDLPDPAKPLPTPRRPAPAYVPDRRGC